MAMKPRPLSPHLQVYRPQITSVLSISHRVSGVVLLFGSIVFVGWLLAFTHGPQAYAKFTALFTPWYGQTALVLFTFALFYHLCNGIRHLFWDMGKGFELETVTRSGMAVIFASLGATALFWLHMTGGF
ncbi:MAG: succinate dehydrogenase, cytochrome b556 subunit [Hyphomicrobiales bacterium]|nr:succinate dehydrogenase, cytochrome b556 subunit [Hyphomicrobiales bacterium]